MAASLPDMAASLLARTAVLGAFLFAALVGAAQAQQRTTMAIVYTVGDTAGLVGVAENFAPVTDALSRRLGSPVNVSTVSPTNAKGVIESGKVDLLLLLTSDAWRAQNEHGWRIVALSSDTSGNIVQMAARKGVNVKDPAGLKGLRVATSGTFNLDVTTNVLKSRGVVRQVRELRDAKDADALTYFIQNGFTDVVATRDENTIKALAAAGAQVFFKTDVIPVYAVIASPSLSLERLEAVRNALTGTRLPSEFTAKTRIRAFQPLNADHSVALALFDD